MRVFQYNNFICTLGENAKENWELFDISKENDYFFHLSSFPSGYVILEYNGKLTKEMITTSAILCKTHTKYRTLRDVKVDYCPCNNLEKGDKAGEVVFKSNRKVKQVKV